MTDQSDERQKSIIFNFMESLRKMGKIIKWLATTYKVDAPLPSRIILDSVLPVCPWMYFESSGISSLNKISSIPLAVNDECLEFYMN